MNPASNVCKIDAYPDADFARMFGYEDHTDPACAKSRTGFIITFADCPVLWQSKLQTETALSTMEVEIIALSACCRELFPIMDMVSSVTKSVKLPIGKTIMNVSIHEDDLGALVLAKTLPPQFTPRSKYYAIKTIWFREMCNYSKSTQPNNWVISIRKVSHVLFLNISGRRLWDGNSLDPSLFECTSSSLERKFRTKSWGSGYIVGFHRRVKVPSVRSILYSTT
jgi:hypothetical protein